MNETEKIVELDRIINKKASDKDEAQREIKMFYPRCKIKRLKVGW